MCLLGDEFMAIKPWKGAIKAPKGYVEGSADCSAPEQELVLEWVYGYASQGCRNNLKYNEEGELVYHVAAVSIIYDGEKQHFVRCHTDDIVCLAIDDKKEYVATGR